MDEGLPLKDEVVLLRQQVTQYKEVQIRMEEQLKVLERRLTNLEQVSPEVVKEVVPVSIREGAPEVAKIAKEEELSILRRYSQETAQQAGAILDKLPNYIPNYYTKGLEYHGYFRSGSGLNSKGGKMEAFKAPGAPAKYRLGNEQETYIEAIFLNQNWNPDPEGLTLKTQIRVAYQTMQNQTWDPTNDMVVLREMYAQMGHFITADQDIKVWAGQRFCRLPQTEINDFWWYDMSGYGGGFEDINLGLGKLDVTYIGYTSNDFTLNTYRGKPQKSNLNFKLGEIDVPGGKGMVWVNGGFIKGGTDVDTPDVKYPDVGGVDVGAMHYMPGDKVNNQVALMFGTGACTSLSAGTDIPPSSDLRNAWRIRLTEMYNNQFTEKLSMQAVGVYQVTDSGSATKNYETWISVGAPPSTI